MKFVLALFIVTFLLCGSARAATGDPLDLQIRYGHFYSSFIINEDGTSVGSYEWSKTVLKQAALEESRRALVSYDTATQQAEITAAYTLKADGRRIDVPKDKYRIEADSYYNVSGSSSIAGWTTLSVVFPDVAVGDAVVFAYQLVELVPMLPVHYSATQYYYNQVAYDEVRVRFDYPASMWVQYGARGMNETENSAKGDRKIVEWRYANPQPVETGRQDFSVFDPDHEAGYAFSTFKSYAEIASAYAERVLPKAVITERIKKLANGIVTAKVAGDKSDPKQQARALYEWVASNISSEASPAGIGAVVPRDLPYILDNRKGDCKEHAVLLQALLAARGIKSVLALVNAGAAYHLPNIPVATTFDHVLNYLPALDLYLDSTSQATPFGMLPFGDQDKPVLLLEDYREGMKTPVPPAGSNRQYTKSIIRIAPDGSASGSIVVLQHGLGAELARSWARSISKDGEEELVKKMLSEQGMAGSGKFEKDVPATLEDNYHYRARFKAEGFVQTPGALNIVLPLGLATPMQSLLQTAMEGEKNADVVCASISADDEYVIELPKKARVLSIPADMNISGDYLSYSARYRLKKNILAVRRTLDERPARQHLPSAVFRSKQEDSSAGDGKFAATGALPIGADQSPLHVLREIRGCVRLPHVRCGFSQNVH